jgi:hypothetical protein
LAALLCLGAAPAARAATSTLQNPVTVFTTPGSKQVSLTVCNGGLCTTKTSTVVVLDPMPAVTGAGISTVTAEVGQLVRLNGTGTGRPPLTFTWHVAPLLGTAVTVPGATAWWDTTGLTPGIYTAGLTISNVDGAATSLPLTVALLPAAVNDFYTVTPCRVFDSRSGAPLASGSTTVINVAAAGCGIPSYARAVAGNLTVVGPDNQGFVTLYPGNYPLPITSTINYAGGAVRANSVVSPMATDGSGTLALFATVAGGGSVHAVLDVSGYFAPLIP